MSMVTIKDLAREAGVSISTVSYALNGNTRISEETRERIVALAEEMNYVPNMAGRNLRRKTTNIIGVYLASYGGIFYSDLLEGIMEEATKNGYDIIVCSGEKSRSFIPERMVDGALVIDTTFSNEELFKYTKAGAKIVVLDRILDDGHIPSITLDNESGAKQAINELLKHENRSFYLISGPEGNYDSQTRLEASISILEQNNVPYKVLSGDFTSESGRVAAEIILSEWQGPISIFAFNDEMAIGLIEALHESPHKVGEDVKLVGFDDSIVGKYIQPSLTSVAFSKHKWGKMAANTLFELINKKKITNEELATYIKLRDSSK